MRKSEYILFERESARNFNEAYPIGNGHLGGMVYGDFPKMRLGLNHDELWTGDRTDCYSDFNKEDFFHARELALQGKYREATELVSEKFGIYDAACYLTLGDLYFDFEDGEISDYCRSLDLHRSEAIVSFLLDGKEVRISYIASYPDKAIFARIEAESPLNFTVSINVPLETSRRVEKDCVTVLGECPLISERQAQNASLPSDLVDKKGVAFAAVMSVVSDGKAEVDNCVIKAVGAKCATVVFTATTSYKNGYAHGNEDYIAQARQALDRASKIEYADVLLHHVDDVTEYFDRVSVRLGNRDCSNLSTSERIDTFENENGELDCDLLTLVFNFGRYLSIASSREGSAPPNLQGIWNDLMEPPWCSNYTTNINMQMNHWHLLACDMPELFEPLEAFARIMAENGKKCARFIYGARGFSMHHNSDIFGTCLPAFGKTEWVFFPLAGAWVVGELYRKYEYTLDREYLENIYPLLEDNVRFIIDMLIDDGDYMIFAPAASPENSYVTDGQECEVSHSTTMFGALIRESVANFLNASAILDRQGELMERAKAVMSRLLPIRITDDGRIEEWYFGRDIPPMTEKEITHRHISHLYDLYPARNITLNTKDLADAAKNSLDVRGDKGTGWCLAWKACCRARLGDGDAVMRLLRLYFNRVPSEYRGYSRGGVYSNLFSACSPMQIDASFGMPAAIAEMLVGECNGNPIPLPALPKQIRSGSVRGLRVRGNRRVDMDFEDGKVTMFKIY